MISAAELRARQASRVPPMDEQRKKAEFTARFKKAADGYYNAIMEEVKLALESIQEQESSYTYIILNFKPLTAEFEGLKYTTLLYGYWNKERNAFDDSAFAEYGVEKPFERAKKELAELGYRLENVSDPSISKKLFIKFSWGEAEEKPRKPTQKKVRFDREKSCEKSRDFRKSEKEEYVDRRRYAFEENSQRENFEELEVDKRRYASEEGFEERQRKREEESRRDRARDRQQRQRRTEDD